MNTDRLNQLLEKAFRAEPERLNGGKVWRLKRPRPLAPLLDSVLDTEEERELYGGSFEAWPGNISELLEGYGLHRPLLGADWDGFGPVSWSAGLTAIETGSRVYLCVWDELGSYRLVAAVAPAGNSPTLAAVVSELLAGGALVGHPPHNLTNYAPELLDRRAVEAALAALVDSTNGWGELADEHFGRLVEPDHLQRCLDLLQGLPRLDDRDAVAAWLEQHDGNDGSDLPEPARRRLLTEFLDSAYEEAA
jgi:hypothetical protein